MDPVLISELAGLSTFAGIPENAVEAILKCSGSYFKNYSKGEIILHESEPIELAGLLVRGKLRMIQENTGSSPSLMLILQPGEFFGESYACSNNRYARMSVMVDEPSTVLYMPYKRIMNGSYCSCAYHTRIISNMGAILADKNVRLMERMQVISQRTIREKIMAYAGLEMERIEKQRGFSVGPGEYFVLPHNRALMAKYLCVERTALAREMSAMKAEGIIDYDSKLFCIL